MPNQFSSGKHAIAECDRCGWRYKLHDLKPEIVKLIPTGMLLCYECWDVDHPQLQLGMYPVEDPQAIQNPRRDNSYYAIGNNGAGGSRMDQWGWNPVGGSYYHFGVGTSDNFLTPNALAATSYVGQVLIGVISVTPTGTYLATESGLILTTESGNYIEV